MRTIPFSKSVWSSADGRIVLVTLVRKNAVSLDWDLILARNPRARRYGRNVRMEAFLRTFAPCKDPRKPVLPDHCKFCDNNASDELEASRTWPGRLICSNQAACEKRFRKRFTIAA